MENMSGIFKKGLTKSVFSGYTLFVLRQKFQIEKSSEEEQVVTEGIYRKQPEDESAEKHWKMNTSLSFAPNGRVA